MSARMRFAWKHLEFGGFCGNMCVPHPESTDPAAAGSPTAASVAFQRYSNSASAPCVHRTCRLPGVSHNLDAVLIRLESSHNSDRTGDTPWHQEE